MSWPAWVASIVSGGGIGGVVVALINWRRLGPKTKQETAKIAAETREIDVETQGQLIAQVERLIDRVGAQDEKIASLERTIADQGQQIAALQRRNHDLATTMRSAVAALLDWIKRALAVMTPDQQANVGQPPDYQHLITPPERS